MHVGSWSIAFAPVVSLIAMAWVGWSAPTLQRRSWRYGVVVGACGIFALAALAPTYRWPLTEPASARFAAHNLLTVEGVLNPAAPSSWRLQDARLVGHEMYEGAVASCFVIQARGRVFQVAPYRATTDAETVTADLIVTRLQPADHARVDVRLSEHGTSRGTNVQVHGAVPVTGRVSIDAGTLQSASRRLVLALRNTSDGAVEVCVAGARVLIGSSTDAVALAHSSVMSSGSTLPHRLAVGGYATLLSALLVLAVFGWIVAWREFGDELLVAVVANVLVLIALGVPLVGERPTLLVELMPHRNFIAAQLAAMALFVGIAWRGSRWLAPLLLVATIGVLLTVEVRAALIGLAGGGLSAFARSRRWVVVGGATAMAGVLALRLTEHQDPITHLDGAVSSEARWDLFAAALQAIAERPWAGHGFGASRDALAALLPLHPTSFGHAHNVFLELAMQFGVPAALLVLAVIATTWTVTLHRSRAAAAGLTVLLVCSIVDITLLVASGAATAAMFAGRGFAGRVRVHAGPDEPVETSAQRSSHAPPTPGPFE